MIFLKYRRKLAIELKDYPAFLIIPWKLYLFVPALLFVTFAGSYTDDETWDVFSGGGMSVLTFLTAPWSIGVLYKVLRREKPFEYAIIATAFWLFSSSWFYDGYLFLRDGHYSHRWFSNLFLSPVIYLCAGFLWNLESKPPRGFSFSFLRPNWPTPPENKSFVSIWLISIPLVILAAYVLVGFVHWHF
ncbi:MAG: hypothetical protein K2X77_13055 [Candidatus Obscuribacterales bacterium]|nr:hypothetical protein [Candidatus Obscuribacterales bacterium]